MQKVAVTRPCHIATHANQPTNPPRIPDCIIRLPMKGVLYASGRSAGWTLKGPFLPILSFQCRILPRVESPPTKPAPSFSFKLRFVPMDRRSGAGATCVGALSSCCGGPPLSWSLNMDPPATADVTRRLSWTFHVPPSTTAKRVLLARFFPCQDSRTRPLSP